MPVPWSEGQEGDDGHGETIIQTVAAIAAEIYSASVLVCNEAKGAVSTGRKTISPGATALGTCPWPHEYWWVVSQQLHSWSKSTGGNKSVVRDQLLQYRTCIGVWERFLPIFYVYLDGVSPSIVWWKKMNRTSCWWQQRCRLEEVEDKIKGVVSLSFLFTWFFFIPSSQAEPTSQRGTWLSLASDCAIPSASVRLGCFFSSGS